MAGRLRHVEFEIHSELFGKLIGMFTYPTMEIDVRWADDDEILYTISILTMKHPDQIILVSRVFDALNADNKEHAGKVMQVAIDSGDVFGDVRH